MAVGLSIGSDQTLQVLDCGSLVAHLLANVDLQEHTIHVVLQIQTLFSEVESLLQHAHLQEHIGQVEEGLLVAWIEFQTLQLVRPTLLLLFELVEGLGPVELEFLVVREHGDGLVLD